MAFCGLQKTRKTIKNYKPLSAEQYVMAYYPNKKANWLDPPKDLSESIDSAINLLKDYEILTIEELHKIFPMQTQFKTKIPAKA